MTALTDLLAYETGLSRSDLDRIIETAPRRYKVYTIAKRNGGKREIAQPARELKLIQRVLMRSYLEQLPVHPCATAYVKGRSTLQNAEPHAGSQPILKLDFSDFFPSIRVADWVNYCRRNGLFPDDRDLHRTANILFRRAKGEKTLRLSIGAPTSPHVSNVLMFDFDQLIAAEAAKRGISYTRYADDMTFSSQRIGMLRDMVDLVATAARRVGGPRLRINRDKTTYVTAANQRSVTGVVLGNDGTIGMARVEKRLIRAKVDRAKRGLLGRPELQQLCGSLAYLNAIDPSYLRTLERTYGPSLIQTIQAVVDRGHPIK